MNNQIKIIREKLEATGQKYLKKELLDKILVKFGSSYDINELCTLGIISVLKRGRYYINNMNKDFEDPFKMMDLYFDGQKYTFGGLGVYSIYGYSDQVIEWYTLYNSQFSGDRIIGKTKFIFKKQRDSFFYGVRINKNLDYTYKVMSEERAFIQMIKEKRLINSIPSNIDKNKLIKMAEKNASKRIVKIIKDLCL